MNILFVCRHNRFRSKFAEAYFNKVNKNKNLKAKSAGIFPGKYPLDSLQVKISKELGIKLKGKPQAISTNLLRWKDIVIAITNDLPKGLFNYGPYKVKVIEWKIPDEMNGNVANTKKILNKIKKNIDEFLKKEGPYNEN